jgi:uncharacterized membrane protein
MLNRLHKIVPLQLELVPFMLMVFIIWYTVVNFSKLPETIPTHFNFLGMADGYGNKSQIFVSTGSAVFAYLLLTGVGVALVIVRDPKALINLPASVKNRITPEKAEDLRIFLARCLFALKLLITGLSAYLAYGSIEIALNHWSHLGYWPVIFMPLILATAFLMVIRSLRMAYSK